MPRHCFAGAEEAENVFQAKSKKAFAVGLRADAVSLGAEMAAPCKANDVGDGHHGEELLQLSRVAHVRRFQIKTVFLQMAKETLDSPAHPVERQGLFSLEPIAGYQEMRGSASRLHRLAGEEELKAKDLFTPHRLSPPLAGIFNGMSPPDIGVFLKPDHVADVVFIQVGQPLLSNKLSIKGQSINVTGRKNPEKLFHQTDPLAGVGVSSLGFLRQDSPDDGDGDFSNDDADGQEVDCLATELPVGAIHRENVSSFWLRDSLKDEAADRWEAEREVQKEVLESPVAALVGTIFPVVGGSKNGEIDRGMLHHSGDQKRKALEGGRGCPASSLPGA